MLKFSPKTMDNTKIKQILEIALVSNLSIDTEKQILKLKIQDFIFF